MEREKTIFDYLAKVLATFGASIFALCILCPLVGESAREISPLYALGSEGITISILMQFLAISSLNVGWQVLFLTDKIIKNMSEAKRMIAMFAAIALTIIAFILVFDWFPATMWKPWVCFFVCYGICGGISTVTVMLKNKLENEKMQDALQRIKQEN